jgi:hypothetical protein
VEFDAFALGIDPSRLSRFMNRKGGLNDEEFSSLCRYLALELRPIAPIPKEE